MTESAPYGLLGRFESPEALIAAVRAARAAGYRDLDAYAPFPLPGLAEALGFRDRWIGRGALLSGVLAAAGALFMQWYSAVIDYPYVVGGKPLASWPAFLPITFEVGILGVVLWALITLLVRNGLPKLYHPVFNDPEFDRASGDGFFLLLRPDKIPDAKVFLQEHGALAVREVQP
jgi:hypothetical protein